MSVSVNKAKICVWILGALGILLLLIGIISLSLFPSIFKKKVHENIVLQEGKEAFDKWKLTPIPVSFSVYMFNVTNSQEVQKKGSKPILQEVGPYVFQQIRSKEVLSFDDENYTVTYRDIKTFYYNPDASADQDVPLYTLNMPLMGVMGRVKKATYLKDTLLDILDNLFGVYEENLFVYRTPREMLFGGYEVKLVRDLLNTLRQFVHVREVLPNNTFGYLYGKNNTGAGIFTVYTGVDDIAKYTQIVSWNDKKFIDLWNDKYCGMINGTDGSQFAPPVTRHDSLYVYTPELCRSVHLDYVSDVFVNDILTYRFMTPENLFASAIENPDNQCFCSKKFCEVGGLMDISKCREGAAVFVSGPHFYQGHSSYTDDVEGLLPSQEQHETYVDIEPTTGVVLRASRKLQMNYMLERYDGLPQTRNAPSALLPLFWIREEAEISPPLAAAFKAKVKTPVTVAKSVLTACIVIGILWIVIAGIITVYVVLKQQKEAKRKIYQPVPAKPEENCEKHELEKLKPVDT